MKYFSMPADFRNKTIDEYERLNNTYENSRVLETYGQITVGNQYGSGRSLDVLPQVDTYTLKKFIRYSAKKNIGFNYTINSTFMGNREFTKEGIHEINKFLGELYDAGVRSLTIAMPSLIELVKSLKYDFDIKASTICNINNPNKALTFKKMGASRIVTEESVNRNLQTLKEIRGAFGPGVEIIVNTLCFKDCVNRMFHYNQVSADSVSITSEASVNYFSHRCAWKRFESMGNVLRITWVRPEDIRYYVAAGIENFKLQGRQSVMTGDPVRAVECYFKEDYEGNLMDVLDLFAPVNSFKMYIDNKKLDGFINPFLEDESFCQRRCGECNYCDAFAKKCIDVEKAAEVIEMANRFYRQYDQFGKLVEECAALDQ